MSKALKTIPIFEVRETLNERGSLGKVVGFADSSPAADAFAKDKGWWGGPGHITEATALVINGKVYALRQPEPVELHTLEEFTPKKAALRNDPELRRAALAKLSPEEREALGYEA